MNIEIGSGLCTLLTCIFVIAKIWGKINWSWWWVLSPIWISLLIFIVVLIIAFIVIIIGAIGDWW